MIVTEFLDKQAEYLSWMSVFGYFFLAVAVIVGSHAVYVACGKTRRAIVVAATITLIIGVLCSPYMVLMFNMGDGDRTTWATMYMSSWGVLLYTVTLGVLGGIFKEPLQWVIGRVGDWARNGKA